MTVIASSFDEPISSFNNVSWSQALAQHQNILRVPSSSSLGSMIAQPSSSRGPSPHAVSRQFKPSYVNLDPNNIHLAFEQFKTSDQNKTLYKLKEAGNLPVTHVFQKPKDFNQEIRNANDILSRLVQSSSAFHTLSFHQLDIIADNINALIKFER